MNEEPDAAMLKFGIMPPIAQRGMGLDRLLSEIVEEAQQAEAFGFSSVFLGEHHQQKADCLTSPLLLAMALATQTKRIQIGTGVLIAPLYHPVHVAEDVALIDIASGGRFILGLGAGVEPADFTAFDVPRAERIARTEEFIAILRRCWAENVFSYHGAHYHFENVRINPKPFQKPHPPVWLGGSVEAAVARAAHLADGWYIDPNLPPLVAKQMTGRYRDLCDQRGVTPHVAVMREGWVAETKEQALAEYKPHLLSLYRHYWSLGHFTERHHPWVKEIESADQLTIEHFGPNHFIIGSPEDCIRQAEWWRKEVGVEQIIICFRQHNGPAHERVMETLRLFGEAVIPYVGRAG
ncbi:MAG: LLM class flavin-dependent oxidoreductase [Chloroflexota bacterium]|nr:MAG: LLM class flavin-dependent oxidoreductase [Chloroflexota bacterium]